MTGISLGNSTAPTIASFTPTTGPVGTSVTLTGTNFADGATVSFNGTNASSVTFNSSTSLTVTVPGGATSGPISVTVAGETGTSSQSFTVTVPGAPNVSTSGTLSSFNTTPGNASAPQTLGVTGTNLSAAITANAPSGFEVSTDGSNYGPTATIPQTSGNASAALSIRITASASLGAVAGNLTLSSSGSSNTIVTLIGNVALPVLDYISLNSLGTPFTENFNSLGISATATLPLGFKIGADYNTGTSSTTLSAGTIGNGSLSNTSSGGVYNFADGERDLSQDRALGFLTTNNFPSPKSIIVKFRNNTGSTIKSLNIAFNFEKYRAGTRAFDWTFFHGSSTTPSTPAPDGNQSYPADGAVAVVNPPGSIPKSSTIENLNIFNGNDYYLLLTYTGVGGSTNSQAIGIDDFSITAFGLPPASITPSVTTLENFAANIPADSASQSLTITGTNLTDSITATAPAGFQVSIDNSVFAGTATIPQNDGTASATLFVRMVSNTIEGPKSGNLTLSTPGGNPVLVALSGFVTDPTKPVITLDPDGFENFTANITQPSASQSVELDWKNLNENLTISVNGGFEVSEDDLNFSPSLTIPANGGNSTAVIFVRIEATFTATPSISGNLSIDSTGESLSRALSGRVIDPASPDIVVTGSFLPFSTFTNTPSTIQSVSLTATKLEENISVAVSGGFQVSTDNSTFGPGALITQTGGNATATLFVRIPATATAGPLSGALTLTSRNATALPVPLSGTVVNPPELNTVGTPVPFVAITGQASDVQSVEVTAANLIGNISVSVSSNNFQISTNNSTFGPTATIPQTGGSASGTILIRVPATAPLGPISANLTISSTNASSLTIPISGTVVRSGLRLVVPTPIRGGAATPGRVFLAENATTDVLVRLFSDTGQLRLPISVTVPAGQDHVVFPMQALAVSANVTARLDAITGILSANALTTINATVPRAVSLRPEGYTEDFATFLGTTSFPYGWAFNGANIPAPLSAWNSNPAEGAKHTSDQAKVFGAQPALNATANQTVVVRNDTQQPLTTLQITYTGRTLRGPRDPAPADRDVFYTVTVNGTAVPALYYNTAYGDQVVTTAVIRGLNIPLWSTFPITWNATVGEGFNEAKQIGISDVRLRIPVPSLTLLPPAGWSDFTTTLASPSSPSLFYASGENLSAPMVISATPGYQVSLSPASGYNGTVVRSAGNSTDITAFPVYVRLTGSGNGTVSGLLSVSSNGATTLQAPLGGVVFSGRPTTTEIHPSRLALEPFQTFINSPSEPQSFHVSGRNLGGSVTIFAPSNYQVRLGGNGFWSSGVVLLRDPQNNLSPTQVQVRMSGSALGDHSGKIRLTSNLVDYSEVAVSGTVLRPAPEITMQANPGLGSTGNDTFSLFSSTRGSVSPSQSFTVSATDLRSVLQLRVPDGFEINASGAGWQESIDLVPDANNAIAETTVSIRIGDFSPAGSISGSLRALSSSALTQELPLIGLVTESPAAWISARPASLPGFRAPPTAPSEHQLVEVSAKNLSGALNVQAPSGFEISADGKAWVSSLELPRQNITSPGGGGNITRATDNAANYLNGWTNGSNGGSGFGPWVFRISQGTGFAGTLFGNPTNSEVTNFGTSAFGLYANPLGSGANATVERSMPALEVGDSFRFRWAVNYDSGNGGRKGFKIFAGGVEVVNVVQGDYPGDIVCNGRVAIDGLNAFNTSPMTWTFTRTSQTNLLVTSTARDGSSPVVFTTNVNLTAGPDSFAFYAIGMSSDTASKREPWFNNFVVNGVAAGVGEVPPTSLLVRLSANSTLGAKSGNLVVSGGSALSRQIALSGQIVDGLPNLSVNPLELINFIAISGTPSSAQSFSVNATNLGGPLSLIANAGLEISRDGITYSPTLAVVPVNGSVLALPIFVRLSSLVGENDPYIGEIEIVAPGEFPQVGNSTVTKKVLATGLVAANDAVPQIFSPEPPSLSGFRTTAGTPSPELSFVVNAAKLSGNLTASVPPSFEVAVGDGPFESSASISPDQGFVHLAVFRVRISANATASNPLDATLSLSTPGGTPRTVALSGIVDSAPAISFNPTSLNFSSILSNASASQTFSLNGSNLLFNGTTPVPVTITASGPFEVSLTGAANSWSNSVTYNTPAGGNFSQILVRVRLSATAPLGNSSGTLSFSATGLINPSSMDLTGVVNPRPLILLNGAQSNLNLQAFTALIGQNSTTRSFQVSGENLQGDIEIIAPAGFEVSSTNGTVWQTNLKLERPTSITRASDNAGNYPSGWTDGSNGGAGFGQWQLQINSDNNQSPSYFAGSFIGDPGNAGITGMGTQAFGLYANPGGTSANATVSRTMPALAVGDSFSFQWATNWDSDVGNKGFNILAGNQTVVNVNQAAFPGDITFNGGLAIDGASGYGSGPMTWTFTRTTASNLLVTSTARDGSATIAFSTNVIISAAPDRFSFYTTAMGAGDQRQPYFNDLLVSAPPSATIPAATILVRMRPQAQAGPLTGNISITSTLAISRAVTLSGTVQLPPPPVVSGATSNGAVGVPLSFTVNATNSPTSFSTTGAIPPGLSLNATTGVFNGTPNSVGNYTVTVNATNPGGSGSGNITFVISKGTPVVSPAPTASPIFTGQILANSLLSGGNASVAGSFAFTTPNLSPLPGTTSQNVTFTPVDTANWNPVALTVNVTVQSASALVPVVSPDSFNATVGVPFSASVNATNGPTSFSSTNLPGGLVLNSQTGAISGTPVSAGNFSVGITANNAIGSGSGNLTITVAKGTPQITTKPTARLYIDETLGTAYSPLAGGAASINGTFEFVNPAASFSQLGNQSVQVRFLPQVGANWNTLVFSTNVTVDPLPIGGNLTISTLVTTLLEGDDYSEARIRIRRSGAVTDNATITIVQSPASQLQGDMSGNVVFGNLPTQVFMPAGSNSTVFYVIAKNDSQKSGNRSVSLSANSRFYNPTSTPVTLLIIEDETAFTGWSNGLSPAPELVRDYAIGGAAIGQRGQLPVLSLNATHMTLDALVRTDDPKLTYRGEWTTDLRNGTWTPVLLQTPTGQNGLGNLLFSIPLQNGETKKFLRLKVTLDE